MSTAKQAYLWFVKAIAADDVGEDRNDVIAADERVIVLSEMFEMKVRIVADHVIAERSVLRAIRSDFFKKG